ncbi:hypothetical protein BGZ63DRAFT_445723 [Mariannaea sp. PMI_226]|nr:hypothetical protein BGZ63DRAFT_445723 [Mariannaea sp. PMI_226]
MKLANLSVLGAFVASATAADCLGATGQDLSGLSDAFWEARQNMCGNSQCAYQQPCKTTATRTTISAGITYRLSVSISRKNIGNTKGFTNCWDATEDIINQCVNTEHKPSGTWVYNGQYYQIDSVLAQVSS